MLRNATVNRLEEALATAHALSLRKTIISMILGFDPGAIDGIRGGRTLDARNHYREAKNPPRVSQIEYETAAGLLD